MLFHHVSNKPLCVINFFLVFCVFLVILIFSIKDDKGDTNKTIKWTMLILTLVEMIVIVYDLVFIYKRSIVLEIIIFVLCIMASIFTIINISSKNNRWIQVCFWSILIAIHIIFNIIIPKRDSFILQGDINHYENSYNDDDKISNNLKQDNSSVTSFEDEESSINDE